MFTVKVLACCILLHTPATSSVFADHEPLTYWWQHTIATERILGPEREEGVDEAAHSIDWQRLSQSLHLVTRDADQLLKDAVRQTRDGHDFIADAIDLHNFAVIVRPIINRVPRWQEIEAAPVGEQAMNLIASVAEAFAAPCKTASAQQVEMALSVLRQGKLCALASRLTFATLTACCSREEAQQATIFSHANEQLRKAKNNNKASLISHIIEHLTQLLRTGKRFCVLYSHGTALTDRLQFEPDAPPSPQVYRFLCACHAQLLEEKLIAMHQAIATQAETMPPLPAPLRRTPLRELKPTQAQERRQKAAGKPDVSRRGDCAATQTSPTPSSLTATLAGLSLQGKPRPRRNRPPTLRSLAPDTLSLGGTSMPRSDSSTLSDSTWPPDDESSLFVTSPSGDGYAFSPASPGQDALMLEAIAASLLVKNTKQ